MKKVLFPTALLSVLLLCLGGLALSQPIENELYLITPVSKDVHDPMLKAFATYATQKWNINLKTGAIPVYRQRIRHTRG